MTDIAEAIRRLALCVVIVCLAGGLIVPALAEAAGPDLSVTGASLIEASTGQVLYGQNADSELAIASTTKIMTALITLQHEHHLGVMFTQNDYTASSQDSQIGLEPGEQMSVHDLLLAMLLPSADDAAEDLAYNVGGGSIDRFVGMMNAEARTLGLTHTHYTTPVGLDTPGNYSSPTDLVKLANDVLNASPFFRRVVDLPSAVLRTGRYQRFVVNRNDLVGRIPWITGVKTGHTLDAGYVLVAAGTRDGMTLIGSVLGTSSEESRDDNALALLDYGFATFHIVNPVREGQVMASAKVRDESAHAVLTADGSYTHVVQRTDQVTVGVKAPHQLSGPLPLHAIVGAATVRLNGHVVARIPLVLAKALPAVSPLTQAGHFLSRPSTLLLLVLGAALGLVAIWWRRPRAMVRGRLEEG